MNICAVFQIMLAMAQTHADVPANQAKIAEALKYMQGQCQTEQKKTAKKPEAEKAPEADQAKDK